MNERSPSLRRAVSGRAEAPPGGIVRRPWEGRAEQIIEVAAELFRERGYVGTSMSDIADAVGILPGSLYHYISSKQELLYSIIDRAHRRLIDAVNAQPLDAMSSTEALRVIVRTHIEQIAENLTFGIVSNVDLRELDEGHREAILQMRSAYQRTLIDVVRRGQNEGAWCRRIDPILSSLAVTAIGNSPTGWYRSGDTRWSVDAMSALYSSMVIRSLSCDHEPPCVADVGGG